MKKVVKRTAVAALAGVMAAGMLAGCGEKKLDGTQIVATVDGTEIPMGILSLASRQQQARTEAIYKSFMGDTGSIWSTVADEESGETYGEQAVKEMLEYIELMCIMEEKAADYGVEVTEDNKTAIEDAAKAFMEANSEEVIEALAVTEDQVKRFLELHTYRTGVHEALLEEAEVEVNDDDVNQSAFSYINISISDEELTEDDIKKKKEQAQEILDKMKEDPEADMKETAKAVDENYTAFTGTFTTVKAEDGEASSSYPDKVLDVLRGLKEGEVAPELVETEKSYYIVRLDKELDEEATQSKREFLENTQRNEYYTETTDKWLEEADVKVDEEVLGTLKITDSHKFTFPVPETEEVDESDAEAVTDETAEEEAEAEPTEEPEEEAEAAPTEEPEEETEE